MAVNIPAYKTITAPVTVEQTIEKSRFICDLAPVTSEEEAREFIAGIRKSHSASRHVCSAFVVGKAIPIARSNDDGEPSGTAGRPILSVLEGAKLVNVVAAVTPLFWRRAPWNGRACSGIFGHNFLGFRKRQHCNHAMGLSK